MPALCIIRHNLSSKQKYDQMIKRGKLPKVAITAIMRMNHPQFAGGFKVSMDGAYG